MNAHLPPNRKNLVIVRAGNNSLHPEWLKGMEDRSWDLVINYYGDDPTIYRDNGATRIDSKGPKWPALHALFTANPNFLRDYSNIWLPDDDLLTKTTQINQLFHVFNTYALQVAQPALTWNSYFGHLTTLKNIHFKIRFTNYVEVMAPCFSAQTLAKALPLLNVNLSGWGLDFVWTKLVDHPEREIAIIDSVTVQHTRPVGGPNYKMLRENGVSPWDELRNFCKENGLDEEPIILTYSAVCRNDTLMNARDQPRQFTVKAISGYVPALLHSPTPRKMIRRMAGMAWKSFNNVPDRVSETPTLKKHLFMGSP
jgi:Protein of unknown function (DUF707)